MPDPISADRTKLTSYDGDLDEASGPGPVLTPTTKPGANVCEDARMSTTAAVVKESYGTMEPTVLASPSPSPAPSSTISTNTNAERTSAQPKADSYASAGRTSSGDSVFAGAALVKGQDGRGSTVEVLSASAQVATSSKGQTELQAGLVRMSVPVNDRWSVAVESMTARVHAGSHNDDGSTGKNIGVAVTLLGAEASYRGDSLQVAVGASLGPRAVGFSKGVRDQDNDGKPEYCIRGEWGSVAVGVCVEGEPNEKLIHLMKDGVDGR